MAASGTALAIMIVAAATVAAQVAAPGNSLDRRLVIEPTAVTARLFYHGQTVRVRGTAPAGHEVAIVIRGEDGPIALMLKGKVGGVIWSNIGNVTIDNVPSLYLVATSPGLRELVGANPIEIVPIGYRALESRFALSPVSSATDGRRIFEEFIKLKEEQDLYGVNEGGVRLAVGSSGDLDCTAEFFIPPDVPVGSFDVQLVTFDRDRETVLGSAVLTVEQAGLAATISTMARDRGLLYGVLSVIVALLAGVLAGIVFGHRSKGGH